MKQTSVRFAISGGAGAAEEIPTPVGGGELELIECTIETCLFVEIKCVHYIANTHTHTHTHMRVRAPTAQTDTRTYGGKIAAGKEK